VRLRVLDVCRRLFNEEGFATVTIARIADRLGMNEGRLHYYFNTKQQIVLALFDIFERAMVEAAARGLDSTDRADRYADYQENWFVLMWRFRFIYRDHSSLHRIAPTLRHRLAILYAQGQTQFRHVLDDMVSLGLVIATPEQRDHLVVNAWVISTYWIDYVTTARGTTAITRSDIQAGMRQIDNLFTPYITEAGRKTRKSRITALD
jgi:AcrR family transcriptional regulator